MSWDDAIDGVDRDTPGGRMPRAWEVARRFLSRAANDDPASDGLPAYAELHCLSDFSFLRGASSAEDLFVRAAGCGYQALAITDECSLAGIVRAFEASVATGVKLIVGSEFNLTCGLKCILLVESKPGYQRLCELITLARRSIPGKGSYRIAREDFTEVLGHLPTVDQGLVAMWVPTREPDAGEAAWLKSVFGQNAFIAVELHRERDDSQWLSRLLSLAGSLGMDPVATGDVHMATRQDRRLQDVMTAIRHNTPLSGCGQHLFRNGERHLRARRTLANIYPRALLEAAAAIASRCTFDLKRDREYRYPIELVPKGHTPASWLRHLTEAGMQSRWPEGAPPDVVKQIDQELSLISELGYEAFFLTVEDIVRFAKGRQILCQGRGSSANSAVCYALGITVVNPAESRLLMARFLSRERKEPPDIDVDFEHEEREQVIQYIYGKYGRKRAALVATVIRYRGKSAVRDVAKAFGFPPDQIALLAGCHGWGNGATSMEQRLLEAGFDPGNRSVLRVLAMVERLEGHPRHLSQHVGGFVIGAGPLSAAVPVENAAMPGRTIVQWDKDDLETMGMLKVDCLALGMLTCIRKAIELVTRHRGYTPDMAKLPKEDEPATFAMIQAADTVGVFQIESRAQMSMLPRLKPEDYYDLVVEVAIVRPGPIQGGMVHPYLKRRKDPSLVTYPSDEVRDVLKPTLGVPLFQEQVMELLKITAGYSDGEADALRRSMASWRHGGDMAPHQQRMRERMSGKYSPEFIDQIFEQIKGFGSYGFPQSHAASFAKLVYVSCWLKRHEPAAFACALLNAQPMGFYQPSQIVQDARRGHACGREAIEFLPVDVRHSDWDNTLHAKPGPVAGAHNEQARAHNGQAGSHDTAQPAIRLGFRQVAGLSEQAANAIVSARAQRAFADVADLCRRASLDAKARSALAEAGALDGLAGHRNAARWQVAGVERAAPLQALDSPAEAPLLLPAPSVAEDVLSDYRTTSLTLGTHPLALLRDALRARRVVDSRQLLSLPHGRGAFAAGLVTQRQRPATAKGTVFVTLEDEHGMVNVVVWQALAARRRKPLLGARLLGVRGRWEQVDGVRHLIARDLHDLSHLLGTMQVDSRDFR